MARKKSNPEVVEEIKEVEEVKEEPKKEEKPVKKSGTVIAN